VAGDFSTLTIDTSKGASRVAPPALLVAMAVGLGSMDMPVPAVAEWEWLNWKFPRAVRAGETIYARWTLTQKRAPVGSEPTAIVVWRVDVHNASGALCAEGEVGASVTRRVAPAKAHVEEIPAAAPAAAPRRRRGRRRAPAGEAAKGPVESKPLPPKAAPVVSAPAASATPERAATGTRRRRRRRPSGAAQSRNGESPAPAAPVAEAPVPHAAPKAAAGPGAADNPLTRVIRRLRRP
jgi:hypothetical protein